MGFRAVVPRMSGVPADLPCHASIQGLKCLNQSLVLESFLEVLEEEVELCVEHVHLLHGVHAPLAWLEMFFVPNLVSHHLLDQSLGPVNG
jgi:hypothetical protein